MAAKTKTRQTAPLTVIEGRPEGKRPAGVPAPEIVGVIATPAADSVDLWIGRRIGQDQIAKLASAAAKVSDIANTVRIKDSGDYKGTHLTLDGNHRDIRSWDDFCKSCLGRDRSQVDDDIKNLKTLGNALLLALFEVGLPSSKINALAATDMADDALRRIEVAASRGAEELRGEVMATLQAEEDRHKAEVEALNNRVVAAESDVRTKQRVIDKKNEKIDDLEHRLQEATAPPPSDAAAQVQELERLKLEADESLRRYYSSLDRLADASANEAVTLAIRHAHVWFLKAVDETAMKYGFTRPVAAEARESTAPLRAVEGVSVRQDG